LSTTLAACTSEDEPAQPGPTAETFLEAWAAEDFETMAASFTAETAQEWTPEVLSEIHDAVQESGAIESFEVELAAEVDDPEAETIEAPYSISYSSQASRRPVRFEGALPLSLDVDNDVWQVRWDETMLFPGVAGATAFKITSKWPARADIVDRKGRKVAVGSGMSRSYPFGSHGGSTVGHIEPATKKHLRSLPEGYGVGDLVGASGLEEGLEERLSGEPSSSLYLVDERGRRLEKVGQTKGGRAPAVKISLDMRVQAAAENAYSGATGGAVVIEPRTGYVLAAVGSGPFDPNNYVGVPDIEPFNRALSGLYPPGSAMKVVTAAAAIDAGVVKPSTTVTGPETYQGVRNFESGTFGAIPFSTAMQNSVNTAFAQIAEDLGAKRMYKYATAFGFNRELSMPLSVARSSFPRPQDLGDLMWGSIGQAQVVATPLQMASVAATIANKGRYIEPRIVVGDPPEKERAVTPKTARTVNELMQLVVRAGTGTAANLGSAIPVAGKTGTAEVGPVGDLQNHAWFVCFAPADKPKIAVAVVSEFGGTGGSVAAPIARQVLQAVLPLV
jgi:cell division protein FtsI/penicillin-binding protein 2